MRTTFKELTENEIIEMAKCYYLEFRLAKIENQAALNIEHNSKEDLLNDFIRELAMYGIEDLAISRFLAE